MVKIDQIKTYTPVKPARLKAKQADGSFNVHVNTPTEEVQNVTAPQALEAMSQLMQVQEIGERATFRKQCIEHGDQLLDDLNRLQLDILTGDLNENSLKSIVDQIKRTPRRNDDLHLQEILDQIQQRAEIELAKIEMSRRTV